MFLTSFNFSAKPLGIRKSNVYCIALEAIHYENRCLNFYGKYNGLQNLVARNTNIGRHLDLVLPVSSSLKYLV